jgi:hypothetical protein
MQLDTYCPRGDSRPFGKLRAGPWLSSFLRSTAGLCYNFHLPRFKKIYSQEV